MLFGGALGGLEVRQDGEAVRVAGRFPYDTRTELAPGYFETIARGAFASRVNSDEDLHFLSGHDFEKPLASRKAGTFDVREDDDALTFEATVASATTWARDFLAAHQAGLIRGLSPGFRVPKGGERVTRDGEIMHRMVTAADLIEVSAVTRPAYSAAQIEARNWTPERVATLRQVSRPAAWKWR
ncbi:HK97 family phage prohead protease [Pseudaestuariivita rosea]|uniref:HK97 family phage prohead protease n=1 Tax=Pseudaestuariivita rosea TaxID=2763263 RepID=UPI001ABBBD23|nr:HK97 family phage prohead protease [Pseudaestuariivita rosea]